MDFGLVGLIIIFIILYFTTRPEYTERKEKNRYINDCEKIVQNLSQCWGTGSLYMRHKNEIQLGISQKIDLYYATEKYKSQSLTSEPNTCKIAIAQATWYLCELWQYYPGPKPLKKEIIDIIEDLFCGYTYSGVPYIDDNKDVFTKELISWINEKLKQ